MVDSYIVFVLRNVSWKLLHVVQISMSLARVFQGYCKE
jgi:hypothetical protein